MKSEILINEKLDKKELNQKIAEYYYGGAVSGPFKDMRSKEAFQNNNTVDYLKAYREEGEIEY